MLPSLLCAMLVLAASPDAPRASMVMEISHSKAITLGDVVVVKVTAVNHGDEPVPLPAMYEFEWGDVKLEILHPLAHYYRYVLQESPADIVGRSLTPLAPGERRVVLFEAFEFPPGGQIQHQFWTDMTKEKSKKQMGALMWVSLGGYREIRTYRLQNSIEEVRPRPQEEVDALTEIYSAERPFCFRRPDIPHPSTFGLTSFPFHMAEPDKLAELESKLGPGTLRDILRATRLMQILVVTNDNVHGDAAERRAAAKELLALLNESGTLEREWLAYNIFQRFYYKNYHPDAIDQEFLEAAAKHVPEELLRKMIGHARGNVQYWPFLKREKEAEVIDAHP